MRSAWAGWPESASINRDDVIILIRAAFIAAFIVLVAASLAHAKDEPKLPQGITCAYIRERVAELGRVKALALAIQAGASWHDIREGRKCLR